MKNILKLASAIVVCELVGFIGAFYTISAIPTWYETLNKPFFSPPNWLFGPVWTILYLLMGISVFLIWKKGLKNKKVNTALEYFLLQLMLNFIWTPIFFGAKMPLLAFFVIVAMWIFIALTIKKFYPISKIAAYLLLPYLAWVSFATLLNASIAVLN
jgi:tryptophan-rich sensory protein